MRLFAAAYPPPEAVTDLEAAISSLRPTAGLRWSPVAHWHVTLAFLGDVADEVVPDVAAAIGRAAAVAPALRVSLRGAGLFGGRGGATVWAGVSGDLDALVRLSAAVGAAARGAGATYPDRRPRPHLTLGRETGRGRGAAERVRAALEGYAGPSWDVDEVRLVRSLLGPPLRHEPVGHYPVGGG